MKSSANKDKKSKFSPSDVLYELANLIEPGIGLFRKKCSGLYDYLDDDELLKRRDELRLLWLHQSGIKDFLNSLPMNPIISDNSVSLAWEDGTPFDVDTARANWLEMDWLESGAYTAGIVIQEHICRYWINLEGGKGWDVVWKKGEKRIKSSPNNLPKILLLTCIRLGDRFSYCHNPECSAPYFLAKRKDQVYCSTDCSAYGQRASKLKWWHEHKGKLPQKSVKEGK